MDSKYALGTANQWLASKTLLYIVSHLLVVVLCWELLEPFLEDCDVMAASKS
jgi:hypothetical protein